MWRVLSEWRGWSSIYEIIEKKKKDLSVLTEEGKKQKGSLEKLNSNLKTAQETFRDKVWRQVYKKHEHNFKEAFSHFRHH